MRGGGAGSEGGRWRWLRVRLEAVERRGEEVDEDTIVN